MTRALTPPPPKKFRFVFWMSTASWTIIPTLIILRGILGPGISFEWLCWELEVKYE